MKTKFLFLSLGVAALFSCTPEDPTKPEEDPKDDPKDPTTETVGDVTLKAKVEAVENGPAIAWKSGDAISLFDAEKNVKFTTTGSGAEADFTGKATLAAESYSAVYPYSEKLALADGKVSLNIPAAQTPVAGGYDAKGAYAVAEGKDLQFKNAFALLKITVAEADGIASVEVAANGKEALAGDITVGTFANPVIEKGAAVSDKVSLSGALNGTYYIVVMPQTLSAGYTLTLANAAGKTHVVAVDQAATAERNKVLDLGSYSGIQWEPEEQRPEINPNPTSIPGIKMLKASFKEAEFNVLGEAGFEEYGDKGIWHKTSWFGWDQAKYVEGHTGSHAIRMDNPTPGFWGQIAQGVAMRPNTDYVYTVMVKGNCPNAYNGVVVHPGGFRNEIPGGDWQPKDDWHQLTREFRTGGEYYAEVFAGIWGDTDMYFTVDDFRLIPKGYDKKSMDTESTAEFGTTENVTYDEITALGKAVAWKGTDGNVYMALYQANIGGTVYDNCVAVTNTTDIADGISLRSFNKAGDAIAPILEVEAGQTMIPNSAIVIDGKVYLHYTLATMEGGIVKAHVNSGFMVSEDNGQTWKKGAGVWDGENRYAHMSVTKKGDWYYAAGTTFGRSHTVWANTFVARAATGKDISDPASWEYFDGGQWITDYHMLTPSCCLTVGDQGEPALVYNEKFGRFMMIYRSNTHGGLVYRDAAEVDDFWSAEKILTDDDVTGGMCFAPSVMEVKDNGEIVFVAPLIGNVLNVDPFLL